MTDQSFCVLEAYIGQRHFLHPRIACHGPWIRRRSTDHRVKLPHSTHNPMRYQLISHPQQNLVRVHFMSCEVHGAGTSVVLPLSILVPLRDSARSTSESADVPELQCCVKTTVHESLAIGYKRDTVTTICMPAVSRPTVQFEHPKCG